MTPSQTSAAEAGGAESATNIVSIAEWLQRQKTEPAAATTKPQLADLQARINALTGDSFRQDSPAAESDEPELIAQAQNKASKLLASKPLSVSEMRLKLKAAEYPESVIDTVVYEFIDRGYLDDYELAVGLVERLRSSKGYSRGQIKRYLAQRKISSSVTETALGQLDSESEQELLTKAATDRAARLSDLEYHVAKRRLVGFLARRGWYGYDAQQAAEAALRDVGVKY